MSLTTGHAVIQYFEQVMLHHRAVQQEIAQNGSRINSKGCNSEQEVSQEEASEEEASKEEALEQEASEQEASEQEASEQEAFEEEASKEGDSSRMCSESIREPTPTTIFQTPYYTVTNRRKKQKKGQVNFEKAHDILISKGIPSPCLVCKKRRLKRK